MILVFSGAGISKASGIGTFIEQPELRDKLHRSYAQRFPNDYKLAILSLFNSANLAQPNDAHLVLAEYNIPVITMNIDGLHEKAGSTPLTLHGTLPKREDINRADKLTGQPVLYGDLAPNYETAFEMVDALSSKDVFIVVGASSYTNIADQLRMRALVRGANVIEVNQNAEVELREVIEKFKAFL